MQDPSGATVLAGKYKLVHQLGKGGMGTVWLAQHLTLHSPVAIKLIEPAIASNPEALARFMREARAAAALRSPHVVQILDHGVDDGTPYIAMELLEGESLAERLRKVGRLSPEDTARILNHTSRAVSRAHEVGVTHRDLKPDNIFLIENEEEELAKVLDFGIAKSTIVGFGVSAVAETRTGALLGTLHYMSPEQTEGVKTVDFRTDIWAMGVIAFECLVGRKPFEGETVGTLVLEICTRPLPVPSELGKVPAGFDAWFARACARQPADRFPSARDAATELRRICQPKGLASDDRDRDKARALPPEGARTEVTTPSGRRPVGLLVAMGVAVAAIVAVAVVLTRPGSHSPTAVSVPAVQPAGPAPGPVVAAPAPEPVPIPAKSAEPSVSPPDVPRAPKLPATPRPRHRADKTASKQASRPSPPEPVKPAAATSEKPKVNLGF